MSVCPNPSSIKTAALYIRVSTHDQEELSPDSQKRLLLEYAKDHHISVPDQWIFQENGISGRKADKRPQFQRMIAQAKSDSHPFDAILVWKFSRFARNQEESIVYKSMLKNKYQVSVVSISEPPIDGPFGSLIERIIEWMDEFYSIRLSGDVTRGMTEKALRGGYQCRPPFGYRLPVPGAALVPDPKEAPIVRQIFLWYSCNHESLSAISRRLEKAEVRTRLGNLFDRRSLSYILQNPVYAGKIRWNRTDSSSKTVRDPSQWIFAQGVHPPLVTEDLFLQAVSRLEAEKKASRSSSPRPGKPARHWLSGLIKCPECGQTLSSCTRRRKTLPDTIYFQCANYIKGKCLCSCYLPESLASSAVIYAFDTKILQTLPVSPASDALPFSESDTSSPPTRKDEKKRLLQRRQLLCQKLRRARTAYLAGIDTLEEYAQTKSSFQLSFSQIETAIRALNQTSENAFGSSSSLTLSAFLASPAYTALQKNLILKRIIRKIVFYKDERRIDIYLRASL